MVAVMHCVWSTKLLHTGTG